MIFFGADFDELCCVNFDWVCHQKIHFLGGGEYCFVFNCMRILGKAKVIFNCSILI